MSRPFARVIFTFNVRMPRKLSLTIAPTALLLRAVLNCLLNFNHLSKLASHLENKRMSFFHANILVLLPSLKRQTAVRIMRPPQRSWNLHPTWKLPPVISPQTTRPILKSTRLTYPLAIPPTLPTRHRLFSNQRSSVAPCHRRRPSSSHFLFLLSSHSRKSFSHNKVSKLDFVPVFFFFLEEHSFF